MPASLLPILSCPLCDTPNSLTNPTTLHCGHSLCQAHLDRYPSCPVPGCTIDPAPDLPTPANPNVLVLHPPADVYPTLPEECPLPPRPKVDVTLSKVVNLVRRAALNEPSLALPSNPPLPTPSDLDDDTEEDSFQSLTISIPSSSTSPPSLTRPRDSPEPSSPIRPRKRRRCNTPPPSQIDDEPDLLTFFRQQATQQRSVRHDQPLIPDPAAQQDRFKNELLAELTCEICFTLLFEPVTTPCQHTFCTKCLLRSQDHSLLCPICRQQLPYFAGHPCNKVILTIILKTFPRTYQERAAAIEAEERNARLDTPVFVSGTYIAFPGLPVYLHFFEPRYRLMLRRCLDSSQPSFGMVFPPKAGNEQSQYGTMLELRRVEILRDGRSIIEAFGTYKFRILERGTLDGYTVARIEQVEDVLEDLPVTIYNQMPNPQTPSQGPASQSSSAEGEERTPTDPEPANIPSFGGLSLPHLPRPATSYLTNEQLVSNCRAFLERLQQGAAPWVVQRLNNWYGPMPTDPTIFSYWVALILPIDDQERAKLFPIRSPRLRLLLVSHWIDQLNNHWYAYSSWASITFQRGSASQVYPLDTVRLKCEPMIGFRLSSSWCGFAACRT